MVALFLVAFGLLSVSRIAAIQTQYGAPVSVYQNLYEHLSPRAAAEGTTSTNAHTTTTAHTTTNATTHTTTTTTTTVCTGQEWHRFPSHYFLPEHARMHWLDDGFQGLLPIPFVSEATTATSTMTGATATALDAVLAALDRRTLATRHRVPYFNDRNVKTPAQFVRGKAGGGGWGGRGDATGMGGVNDSPPPPLHYFTYSTRTLLYSHLFSTRSMAVTFSWTWARQIARSPSSPVPPPLVPGRAATASRSCSRIAVVVVAVVATNTHTTNLPHCTGRSGCRSGGRAASTRCGARTAGGGPGRSAVAVAVVDQGGARGLARGARRGAPTFFAREGRGFLDKTCTNIVVFVGVVVGVVVVLGVVVVVVVVGVVLVLVAVGVDPGILS